MRKFLIGLGIALLFAPGFLMAQEIDENGFNFNSVRPIRRADIMFKKSIWFRVDLREKQNAPFFSTNNEITRVIIGPRGTKCGDLLTIDIE